MRATRAYITSFGTTGLLIASAMATLFVMSAFVAFNGFPGQDVRDPIAPILVHETQAPVSVPTEPARGAVLGARTGGSGVRAGSRRSGRHGGPRAHTTPVTGPRGSAPVQPPSGGQAPLQTPQAGGDLTSATGGATPQLPSGTPSLSGGSTQLPQVTVPEVQVPSLPQDTQLPIDTSGVTNLLGG